jgi:uncharacterized protein (DUF2062 family)
MIKRSSHRRRIATGQRKADCAILLTFDTSEMYAPALRRSRKEEKMRIIALAMAAGVGMLFVPSLDASAAPTNAAAVAGIGQQGNLVINAATSKPRERYCAAGQSRRNKYGYCRPMRSEY